MNKQVRFTREELYQKVWAHPAYSIASEIGISGVALAKACRRAGIPLPGRGYWAALKSGRSIVVPRLPEPGKGKSDVVIFGVREAPPPPPEVTGPPVPPIEVPDQLRQPHPLVAELKAAAKGAKEDNGILLLNSPTVLRVRTSSQQLRRAMILMDTLLKQFEARGYSIRKDEKSRETLLVLKEGSVCFRMDERTRRTPPPPPKPTRSRGEAQHTPWQPAYIQVATGTFVLEFDKYGLHGCRNSWKDRAKSPLEAQLHEVMEAIPTWEALLKAKRIEREEQEARRQEAERRQIAKARAAEVLRRQRARLVNNLLAWERSERIRLFIKAVERAGGPAPETKVWLEWAMAQVEELDPIQSSIGDVTDLEVELESYFTGHSHWNRPEKNWWGQDFP